MKDAWIQTYSGKKFHLLDPQPDEVDIRDIAHALSLLCRFTGHVSWFYSVAEHSVRVSRECAPEDALWGLLHDASEAYLADMNSPLKSSPEMARYRAAEKNVQTAIMTSFRLSNEEPKSVKEADRRLLVTEKRDLMAPSPVWENYKHVQPLEETIYPWPSAYAERAFLDRFYELSYTEAFHNQSDGHYEFV